MVMQKNKQVTVHKAQSPVLMGQIIEKPLSWSLFIMLSVSSDIQDYPDCPGDTKS
jgi:hypothetical protein